MWYWQDALSPRVPAVSPVPGACPWEGRHGDRPDLGDQDAELQRFQATMTRLGYPTQRHVPLWQRAVETLVDLVWGPR